MRTALVLEGGAMRGVFSAGVLDVFLDHSVAFDECYAVSAGACLACSYLSLQRGRGYAVMTDYLDEKEYCSVSSLVRTGDLFGAKFLYHTIPEQLYPIDNEAFRAQKTRFYSVVSNCRTGEAEYLPVRDMFADVESVRASASLPLLSRTVMINGVPYLDGGVCDPIPVARAAKAADRIVIVLTRERSYRKGRDATLALMRLKYRKFPQFVKALSERAARYNESLETLSRLEDEGRAFVIAPDEPLGIRRTEKDRDLLRRGYEQGELQAQRKLTDLLAFLK